MIFAFTKCIGLILAPIPMRCKTLRAAVTLQDWQLDPKIVETNGGQALSSQSPTSHLRKIASLHHFLMQRSLVWWIGFIPDCPLTKSIAELQSLIDNIILAPDFRVLDLDGFSVKWELHRLNGEMNSNISTYTPFAHENRWKKSSIYIKLPCKNVLQEEGITHMLEVPGFYHQSLVEVVTTAFKDVAKTSHFTSFSLYWQPTPESPPEQVYSEIFNLDSFFGEDKKIRGLLPEPGPQYEHAVAALMVSSDSTHLGQFGSAALWPIYLFFWQSVKVWPCKTISICHASYCLYSISH